MPDRPSDVLEAAIGKEVTVLLKDGTQYRGSLEGFDQHLNLVLSAYSAVRPPTGPVEDAESPAGDTIVIRGDNVVTIDA